MHKQYGFEIIDNEPGRKSFYTRCHSEHNECWVEISHDDERLWLSLNSDVSIKEQQPIDQGFFKLLKHKLRLCWDIFNNNKIEYNASFCFKGSNHIKDFCDMLYMLINRVKKETNELNKCRNQLRKMNGYNT